MMKASLLKYGLGIVIFLMAFSVHAQNLKAMTYNIKLDYPKEGENSWINRKPFLINQIKFYEPDVLGVQEAMPNQMKDMDSLLTDYGFVGVGRDDGKNEGEYSAIFYKEDTFKILKSSTFWLSETPENASMGWDAVCNRICTYALLKNKRTKNKIWIFNTHFDHVGKQARKNSAKLIIQKINKLNTKNLPVVLMGDFNMEPKNESIQFIKQYLRDSKTIADISFGPKGTFNGFHFNKSVTKRIDYVFVSNKIQVQKCAILSDNWDLKYPSDHFPVLVYLDF